MPRPGLRRPRHRIHASSAVGGLIEDVVEEQRQHAQPMVHRPRGTTRLPAPPTGLQLDHLVALRMWRSTVAAMAAGESVDVVLDLAARHRNQRLLPLDQPPVEIAQPQPIRADRV
jgi:hypothetical protein